MSDPSSNLARPASVDDLKLLLRALHDHGDKELERALAESKKPE
jgi:hypothetical protein